MPRTREAQRSARRGRRRQRHVSVAAIGVAIEKRSCRSRPQQRVVPPSPPASSSVSSEPWVVQGVAAAVHACPMSRSAAIRADPPRWRYGIGTFELPVLPPAAMRPSRTPAAASQEWLAIRSRARRAAIPRCRVFFKSAARHVPRQRRRKRRLLPPERRCQSEGVASRFSRGGRDRHARNPPPPPASRCPWEGMHAPRRATGIRMKRREGDGSSAPAARYAGGAKVRGTQRVCLVKKSEAAEDRVQCAAPLPQPAEAPSSTGRGSSAEKVVGKVRRGVKAVQPAAPRDSRTPGSRR